MEIRFLFSDGNEILLQKEPGSMILTRESGMPADTLSVSYDAQKPLFSGEPWGVRAERNGTLVFSGIVDEHEVLMEKGVRRESFVCRSLAALLLDNEAMPGLLQMPSLRLMEKLYLKPLGLKAERADPAPKRGQLTVERGTRCWDVLCEFAERFLKCVPHCGRDGTVRFSAGESKRIGLPELEKLVVTRKPSERISRVVGQDSQTGAYSTVYENAEAPVARVRYLSAQSDTAPDAIFSEAERQSLQVCTVCSGYVDAEPGDRADLSAWDADLVGLELASLRFRAENGISETELIFTAGA